MRGPPAGWPWLLGFLIAVEVPLLLLTGCTATHSTTASTLSTPISSPSGDYRGNRTVLEACCVRSGLESSNSTIECRHEWLADEHKLLSAVEGDTDGEAKSRYTYYRMCVGAGAKAIDCCAR